MFKKCNGCNSLADVTYMTSGGYCHDCYIKDCVAISEHDQVVDSNKCLDNSCGCHNKVDSIAVKFPPPKKQEAGLKYDFGKPAMSLLPPDALLEMGKVMEYGASKYEKHNWHKGISITRLLDAADRHELKTLSPNYSDYDDESGLHHLAHAAVDLMMALQFLLEKRSELDDRLKHISNSDNLEESKE